MSFRRSSSLSREDGLTLEQRLVMQLTAAMRHEDSMEAVEEHPAGDAASQPAAHQPHQGQATGPSSGQHVSHYSPHTGHGGLSHGHPQQAHHAPDLHSMDANELSTMLRTLGASLESLGSAIGGHSQPGADAHGHTAQHGHGPLAGHSEPLHSSALTNGDTSHAASHIGEAQQGMSQAGVGHDHSLLGNLGSLEHLGSLSQLGNLGNLGSLLSSIGVHDNNSFDLGTSLETLGSLDLGSIANLGALGGNAQQQSAQQQSAQQQSAHSGPPFGDDHRRTDTRPDSARFPEPTATHVDVGGAQQQTVPQRRASSPRPEPNSASHAPTAEHASLGLSQVEIDPDVSSIQSVLQSLLTAGSATSGAAVSAPSSEEASSAAPQSSAQSDQGTVAAASEHAKDFEMPALANFGLETEDQMLVDSLRSAIESQLSGGSATADAASSSLAQDEGASSDSLRTNRAAAARPAAKPRTHSRTKKPRTQSIAPVDDVSSASFREQSSDFGASDPDTLRAIQQALLSALGPSASSTSLTESLTSELKAATSEPAQSLAETVAASKQQASAVARADRPRPTDMQGAATQSASAKAAERILRVPAKKVTTRVTKPTERDRQKLREENAARKRRWREENVLQNRDNDLRARIIRRAQTMYGEGESTEKSEWIEAEYQRRRQKRILRADINSLVANAMESARSRAASEQAGAQRVGDQPLTLTQQTRQIASSQLSELFRRSNAVLEPQLHAEKLSVPLAPYLLVPSPNRPPYKVEWQKKPSKAAPTVVSPGSHAEAAFGETDKGASVGQNEANTASGTDKRTDVREESQAVPAAGSDGTKASSEKKDEPAAATRANDNAQSATAAAQAVTTADKTDASAKPSDAAASATRADGRVGLTSMRPKHRYGLVGNVQLGVPPNLAAIYRKMMSAAEKA